MNIKRWAFVLGLLCVSCVAVGTCCNIHMPVGSWLNNDADRYRCISFDNSLADNATLYMMSDEQIIFEKWLRLDETSLNTYDIDKYACLQFADDVLKNATENGFVSIWVTLIPNKTGVPHAIICKYYAETHTYELYSAQCDKRITDILKNDGTETEVEVLRQYTISNTHHINYSILYLGKI